MDCSIGSMGAAPAFSSITPLGKHLLHKEPHFDILVIVSDTAEPKRHPQTEWRFGFDACRFRFDAVSSCFAVDAVRFGLDAQREGDH